MKGALCKLKLVQGRFSSVDEGDEGACSSDGQNKEEKEKKVGPAPPMKPLLEHSEDIDTGDVNANSTREGGGPTRPLREALSHGGQFAYCGFLTEALKSLFSDSSQDKIFAEATLRKFLMHIDLPLSIMVPMLISLELAGSQSVRYKTCEVMMMTLRGEVYPGGWKNYVKLLKEEDPLSKNFVLLVQDLVLFAVQGGHYDARTRVLIGHCACLLNVSPDVVEMFEESVLEFLTEGHVLLTPEEKAVEDRSIRNTKIRRYALIGFATISGGALLGLTGGLAAPLIGAGLGTIIGAGGAAAVASTAGMAVIGSLFGAAGAGLTGYKMKKRVGEVEELSFEYLTKGSSLHITIAVSGWLTEEHPDALFEPWRTLFNSREQYCLRYESKYLLELGKAMSLLLQFAFSMAVQESLKYTLLAGIISAITWPASLITLASVIDNPWGVCIRRSAEVGKHLASILLQRHHGRRPVTLIGFSLGARVIYYCLQELVQKEGSIGIVQDVILLGAPVPGYASDWKKFEKVVCGRVINGYCQTDWLLRFLYRTSSASLRIAGLEPVNWEDRRMFNFDLSEIVTGHSDYSQKLDIILKTLGIRTRCPRRAFEDSLLKKSQSHQVQGSSSWITLGSDLRRSVSDSQLLLSLSASNSEANLIKSKEV